MKTLLECVDELRNLIGDTRVDNLLNIMIVSKLKYSEMVEEIEEIIKKRTK